MELADILPKLQDWFPVEDHRERQIKGGGRWYYLPHQAIRDRLNEVCPGDWSTAYDGTHIVDGEPIYHCRLTICGITRTGIGDKSNEPSPFGTSAQRAFRKAFTDAAEQFGIASYLDDQTSEKTKRNFVKYMQSQGNGKAAAIYQEQQRAVQKPTIAPPSQPPEQPPTVINQDQRKELWSIAQTIGGYTEGGFRSLVESKGFASSKHITQSAYEGLCEAVRDPIMGSMYNSRAVNAEQNHQLTR